MTLFFKSEASTDKVDGAAQIYETLVNAGTKHILLFLNYVLAKIDLMNLEFQSQQFRLHVLHRTITDQYRDILGMFISEEVMNSQSLSSIDPANERNFKDLKHMDLGGRCESALLKQPLGINEQRFRTDAKTVLRQLCLQIKLRFPLTEDSLIAQLKALDTVEAMSTESSRMKSIVKLASFFPNLVPEHQLDVLQDQWKMLPSARSHLGHAIQRVVL